MHLQSSILARSRLNTHLQIVLFFNGIGVKGFEIVNNLISLIVRQGILADILIPCEEAIRVGQTNQFLNKKKRLPLKLK